MISKFKFICVFLGICLLTSEVVFSDERPSDSSKSNELPAVQKHGASFVADSDTFNQRQVAKQLDAIVSPTETQALFLEKMESLALPHIQHTLNQLEGQQHAAGLFVTNYINRQFIRRLYDAVRPLVTQDLSHLEWYDYEKECRCYPRGIDCWAEVSGSRLVQEGHSNAIGFKVDGVEGTIGAQKTFLRALTVGIAGSYEYDHLHYGIGGTGNMNSVFGGIYGLYRAHRFYVLANAAYGYSVNKLKRSVGTSDWEQSIHSSPKTYQFTCYGETGVDFSWEDILIQPFIGVEVGQFRSDRINEHGSPDWDLTINARKRTLTNIRFGVHLTSPLPSNLEVSLDLAGNYRCTARGNEIHQHFTTFGTNYYIQGIPLSRSFFDGAITVTKEICCNLNCYGKFAGEMWRSSSAYCVLLGIERSW